MNNTCPTCGALYNVAEKDVGRKLKCKKCSASLKVTEDGLVLDAPTSSAPPGGSKPAVVIEDERDDEEEEEEVISRKKKKKGSRDRIPGINPLTLVGGIPTILFAFGVFLVIVFTSLPIIGEAATDRAAAYVKKLELERDAKIKHLEPKKKKEDWTGDDLKKLTEESQKIRDDYQKQIEEATVDAQRAQVSNRRDVWMERYGLMFGFIVVSFGCIGYLRTEQPLVLKIVAAVILSFMMIVMFGSFNSGCGGKSAPPLPLGGRG